MVYRLGILVEVNCETDFVARGEVFQTLASDIAMQIASNAQVESISKDEFPQELLEKERQIALQMEDIQKKPENIRYNFLLVVFSTYVFSEACLFLEVLLVCFFLIC